MASLDTVQATVDTVGGVVACQGGCPCDRDGCVPSVVAVGLVLLSRSVQVGTYYSYIQSVTDSVGGPPSWGLAWNRTPTTHTNCADNTYYTHPSVILLGVTLRRPSVSKGTVNLFS